MRRQGAILGVLALGLLLLGCTEQRANYSNNSWTIRAQSRVQMQEAPLNSAEARYQRDFMLNEMTYYNVGKTLEKEYDWLQDGRHAADSTQVTLNEY